MEEMPTLCLAQSQQFFLNYGQRICNFETPCGPSIFAQWVEVWGSRIHGLFLKEEQ